MSLAPADAGREVPPPPTGDARPPDLVLARVHLLLGSLSLARAELETLASRGDLDDDGIRDLAEARWRTGDVAGAGEAASAWLETHPDDVLGLVISAEAQSALGRPAEARRLAGRAMDRAAGSLDPVFAGMPRSAVWPVESGTAAGPAGVLFDHLHPGPHAVPPLPRPAPLAHPAEADARPPAHALGPTLWGDEPATEPAPFEDAPEPAALLQGARAALERGAAGDAATALILALRAAPGLAPAILDLLVGRTEPILALVRGDAERIVGREVEAMRDHAAAAGTFRTFADSEDEAEGAGGNAGADQTAAFDDLVDDASTEPEPGPIADGGEPDQPDQPNDQENS